MTKLRERFHSLAIFTVFMYAALFSKTAQGDVWNLKNLTLEELGEIVVTSPAKVEQKILDSPATITVITAQQIHDLGAKTLEEILNYVPSYHTGVESQSAKMIRFVSRGVSSATSNNILILLNGQRINEDYNGSTVLVQRGIDINHLKQIEIIRGPGSAIYGDNAVTGVINLVTADDRRDLFLEIGSLQNRRASVNYESQINGYKLVSYLTAFGDHGYNFHQVTDAFGLTRDTRDPQKGFDLYFEVKNDELSVFLAHAERTLNGFMNWGVHDLYGSWDEAQQSTLSGRYKKEWNNIVSSEFTAGIVRSQWSQYGILIPKGVSGFTSPYRGGPILDDLNANTEIDTKIKYAQNGDLMFGLIFKGFKILKDDSIFSNNPYTGFPVTEQIDEYHDAQGFNNSNKVRTVFGGFFQARHRFENILESTVGARAENYSDFGASLNPRIAFNFFTPANGRIKLIYGQAFRAPTFAELYDRNNPVAIGSSSLKAETSKTIEVGYIQPIEKINTQAALTGFYLHSENLIERNPVVYSNTSSFYNKGIETELMSQWSSNFYSVLNYTHYFKDGLLVSPNAASWALNYKCLNWMVNFHGFYRGPFNVISTRLGTFNSPTDIITGVRISYQPISLLEVTAAVENILDRPWLSFSNVISGGVPNRGRIVTLGASYSF